MLRSPTQFSDFANANCIYLINVYTRDTTPRQIYNFLNNAVWYRTRHLSYYFNMAKISLVKNLTNNFSKSCKINGGNKKDAYMCFLTVNNCIVLTCEYSSGTPSRPFHPPPERTYPPAVAASAASPFLRL